MTQHASSMFKKLTTKAYLLSSYTGHTNSLKTYTCYLYCGKWVCNELKTVTLKSSTLLS